MGLPISAKHLVDIPLSVVTDNPFNPRTEYTGEEEAKLSHSMDRIGLLSPIRVRRRVGGYQVVYGHRRVRAARLLGWTTITAEVAEYSDKDMALLALAENTERNSLSDYEKASAFHRMSVELGLTYEEIGRLVGCSKSHISNYLRMLDLFDEKTFRADSTLRALLPRVSEHHARILARIENDADRAMALKLAVSDQLSVRELERVVSKFRSWFVKSDSLQDQMPSPHTVDLQRDERQPDIMEIFNILSLDFESPHMRDFDSFLRIHSFESGFSIYSTFPPHRRLSNEEALEKEREWFYEIAPSYKAKLRNIDVKFYDQIAIATLYVDYSKPDDSRITTSSGGTVVLVKKGGMWVIVHEHWSNCRAKSSPGQTALEDA